MKLSAELRPPANLSDIEIGEMYHLMEMSFENTSAFTFRRDLREKTAVILLREVSTHILKGFSTQKVFEHQMQELLYRVVFSGDTIIAKDAWGQLALPLAWGEWMYNLWREDPTVPLLWMLISKGYRTYRFLPTFFNTFYPSCTEVRPAHLKSLRDSLGEAKFPRHYDSERGIIRGDGWNYFLTKELAQVADHYQHNQDVEFFLRMNPGYTKGDELLGLTFFSPENLKPFYRRAIERRITKSKSESTRNAI